VDGRDERTRQVPDGECVAANGFAGDDVGTSSPATTGNLICSLGVGAGEIEDSGEVRRQRPVLEFFFGNSERGGHDGQTEAKRGAKSKNHKSKNKSDVVLCSDCSSSWSSLFLYSA